MTLQSLFLKYAKKYAKFAWKNNVKATGLIDSLPSYGPVRTKATMAKRKVKTPLRMRRRNKRTGGRSIFGDNMSVSTLSSRSMPRSFKTPNEPSEKSLTQTLASSSVKCLDKDKEGANEYARSASKKRVGYKLNYQDLQDMIAPAWAEKKTCKSRQIEFSANTEFLEQFVLMDANFVRQRLLKSIEYMPYTSAVSVSNVANNQPVKFEGGRIRQYYVNTCSNTLHFEFVQYKLKNNQHDFGANPTTQDPLTLFQVDQGNTNEYGDLPTIGTDTIAPVNTARLSNWSITIEPQTLAAIADVSVQLNDDFLSSTAVLPAMKRPNPSSPQLRHAYKVIERLKVTLKPGDTFRYDTRIHPFYHDTVKPYLSAGSTGQMIQDYSRILHVYCRAEMVVSVANGQVAPGAGQYSHSTEFDFNWRAIPRQKKNMFIEASINESVLGPYADVSDGKNMEADPYEGQSYVKI